MLLLLKTVAEYGCIIWMATSYNSVLGFTKIIDCFHSYDDKLRMPITTTSYHEQLKILNIYSLQRQRDVIYIYKINIQLVSNPGQEIHYNPRTKVKVAPKQNSSA